MRLGAQNEVLGRPRAGTHVSHSLMNCGVPFSRGRVARTSDTA